MDLEAGFAAVAPRAPNGVWLALLSVAERLETREGIDTPRRWAALLGQCAHESAGFTRSVEGLYYTTPERIMAVWPSRFRSRRAAEPFVGKPVELANHVYARRNGNTQPGDGDRYRGRGWIQLTGRGNYANAAAVLGVDLVGDPELARDPATAFLIAAWYLAVHSRNARTALEWADQGNTEMVTRIVNGGQHGLADRRQKTARAVMALLALDVADRPTLRMGDMDNEAEVTALQEALTLLGYDPGPIDGGFGGLTDTAVRAFQAGARIIVDGIVGAGTWRALITATGG